MTASKYYTTNKRELYRKSKLYKQVLYRTNITSREPKVTLIESISVDYATNYDGRNVIHKGKTTVSLWVDDTMIFPGEEKKSSYEDLYNYLHEFGGVSKLAKVRSDNETQSKVRVVIAIPIMNHIVTTRIAQIDGSVTRAGITWTEFEFEYENTTYDKVVEKLTERFKLFGLKLEDEAFVSVNGNTLYNNHVLGYNEPEEEEDDEEEEEWEEECEDDDDWGGTFHCGCC